MRGEGQKKMEPSFVKGTNRNEEESVERGFNDRTSQTPTAPLLSPSPSSSNVSSHDDNREANDGLQVKATSRSHPDLPTFRRQQERSSSGGHRANRSELIERDAIDTIREHSTAELRDITNPEEHEEEEEKETEKEQGVEAERGQEDEDEKNKRNADGDNTSVNEVNSEEEGNSESGRMDHFRMFFRRNTLKNSSHRERLAEEAEEVNSGKEGGLLEKFISFTGGGLAPAVVEAAMPEDDPEAAAGNAELAAELEETAKQIVQAHHTQSAMEGSSLGGESDQGNGIFFTPLTDHYDDEFNAVMSSDGEDDTSEATYVAPPQQVRSGVLGTLLQLYQKGEANMSQGFLGVGNKGGGNKRDRTSKSSESFASENYNLPNFKSKRPKGSKLPYGKLKRKNKFSEARITVHIADLLQRHRFLLRLCKALMLYGAPTHRLEEYMVMTSRVLEIDGQFLYMPGCMIISFGDTITRTSEVQLVRCTQGLNLWKLHQVHSIYKQVVHDLISVEDANQVIDKILMDNNLYPAWMSVFLYGFCSSMVTPFAFGGDWINLLVSFFIGSCVGLLQFVVARRSNLYSNVFEITASIVVSFCARALGSISNSNICFGATVQGSLALILPGYIILCGSLELQSRNIVAGSVRMFYAIIYSLFLGFGITLGAALFGWIYKGATNETTCARSLSPWYSFIFVPGFSIGIALINQARWVQLPMMVLISCMGYLVTYWSSKHFQGSTEFTASMAAFVIGIMGNLYSRIWKGLAMTAMLPAIFVQVPSGIASKSTLLSSVASANTIVSNSTAVKTENTDMRTSISFGVTMIQVSIGISVGLFASALFVYPFGKKRTGLFTL